MQALQLPAVDTYCHGASLVSVVLQTLINRRVEPLKKSKDKNQKEHLAEAGKAPHDGEAVTTVDKHPFA